MITFKNIITQNVFTIPKTKALEIINQEPKLYEIISGIEKDLLINPADEIPNTDLKNDIYNLVVASDIKCEDKKCVRKPTTKKRKTTKRKNTKVKKKENK